jgi:S1-C subfamily serine protease
VSNEPDDAFSPASGDDAGQTEEFSAQDREELPPVVNWAPHQPPPPPGAPPSRFGAAGPAYQPGPGQVPSSWAHDPAGPYRNQPAGAAYTPDAREAAWPRRRSRRGGLVATGLAAVLAAGAVGGFVGHLLTSSSASPTSSSSAAPPSASGPGASGGSGSGGNPFGNGAENGFGGGFGGSGSAPNSGGTGPADASSIAARVDPGLVDVNTTIDYGAAQGAGTGMVLTSNGEVLTNNHVVDGATSITVTDVGNGRTYDAKVLGYSVAKDVAILQLSGASGLQTVTTAGSAQVSVGEEVVGIGNAGGSGGTPSYAGGSVTATNQSITANDQLTGTAESLTGMIATNADIQSGDSGGPLVNAAGQVIGMDTAGSGTVQFASQSSGAGFAIPIGTASSIAGQITAGRSSSTVHVGATAFLGVQIGQTGGGFGQGSGFGGQGFGGSGSTSGVEISGVVSGGPAAGSGLAAGDVITGVAGQGVTTQSALQAVMVNDVRPGQTVTIQYTDTAGQQHTVSVVLTSGPPS